MTIKRLDPSSPQRLPGAGEAGDGKAIAKDPLSADNLVRLTRGLAVGFKDRIFGTAQGAKAAEWLAKQMQAAGLEPASGDSYFQTFTATLGKQELIGRNVAGMIRGSDPRLKDEVVIVAGHFDSQQDTHEGANDNATGCAGVLAIAQAMKDNPPKRTVLFVTYDGEEGLRVGGDYSPGRRGSRFYAASPLFPVAKTALMVNMDELAQVHLQSGRRDHIYQWASGDPFASRILKNAFAKTGGGKAIDGYPEQPREAQFFTTDAEPLYRLGVPTINLLSGRYLENHGPEDTMKLVIPERMEVYARLAVECVIDAANHPESLADLGIRPGGLMPSFPLINERRGAGLAVSEEESLRLSDLHVRLPELRKACKSLIKELATPEMTRRLRAVAGFEAQHKLVSEANLNDLREHWRVLLDDYRDIPKGDVAARREAKKALELVSGFEGILAASLYLLKIDTSSSYYMQRVPERLQDLSRGANRLGLGEKLAGVVDPADTKKFKAEVNADRALELAKNALPGLHAALSRSAYALLDPAGAAKNDRPVLSDDLLGLESAMTKAAYAALGKVEDRKGDLERTALAGAFLDTTIGRIKGNGKKWVERFAEQNAMLEFGAFARALALPGERQAELDELAAELDAHLFPPDLAKLAPAILAFYGALTEGAFGADRRTDTLEGLIALPKDGGIQKRMEAAARGIAHKVDRGAIAEAAGDATVKQLGELFAILKSTLELRQLFQPVDGGKWHVVAEDTSLRELKARLENVAAALGKVEGGAVLAGELQFWTRWLAPFLDVEGTGRLQAKERRETAAKGVAIAEALWPKVAERMDAKLGLDKGALQSPVGTARALEAIVREAKKTEESEQGAPPDVLAQKVRAEASLKKLKPMLEARSALSDLVGSASPIAVFRLHEAIEGLERTLGEREVKELREIAKRLDALRALGEVEVGRKERSGPMGILSVRAVQKRD